jgi:hypothetical protein
VTLASRVRAVRHGGSISVSTRPSAEPFAFLLPCLASTPIVPRVRCDEPGGLADGGARHVDRDVSHAQPELTAAWNSSMTLRRAAA